jgi:16S rRNA (uracil1498-N3)-methyltransferase
MDLYRFFVPDLLPRSGDAAGLIRLPDDQAHHARTVLRLEPGQPILLFDGAGHWSTGKLAAVGKHELTATLTGPLTTDAPPATALTLAAAIPKGERAEWLVEQASQLDVAAIQWLDTDRGVVKPKEGGGKLAKWRRLAIESAKQCGRTHLMDIREPLSLTAALACATAENETLPQTLLWLEPREGPDSRPLAAIAAARPPRITALIGPEGGWSDREFQLLEARAAAGALTRVRLTRTVLRIETACAAVAALINSRH